MIATQDICVRLLLLVRREGIYPPTSVDDPRLPEIAGKIKVTVSGFRRFIEEFTRKTPSIRTGPSP